MELISSTIFVTKCAESRDPLKITPSACFNRQTDLLFGVLQKHFSESWVTFKTKSSLKNLVIGAFTWVFYRTVPFFKIDLQYVFNYCLYLVMITPLLRLFRVITSFDNFTSALSDTNRLSYKTSWFVSFTSGYFL